MLPERLFNKFEPISCLKKDDYSSVYLANHVYLNKRIILKTLDTSNLPDNSVLHRFQREAKILAKLEHPNIIRVLDFGMYEEYFYISFEYFESKNLRQEMRDRKIPPEQLRDMIRQLFSGLEFAHQHDVVHRDIKPENVLLDSEGCLKIADFGLALLLNEDTMTHKSTIVGTPGYMSPEQIHGEELTLQSDLFSAGLLVYELFEGKNPLIGGDVGKTINAILKVNSEKLIEEATALPEDIQDICLHLLQRDKRKRPESASSILQQLSTGELLGKPSGKFGMPVWLSGAFIVVLALGGSMMVFNDAADKPAPSISEQSIEPVLTTPETGTELRLDTEGGIGEETEASPVERGEKLTANSAIRTATPARSEVEQVEVMKKEVTGRVLSAEEIESGAKNIRGMLDVRCLPWADVYVNGEKRETTPLKNPIELENGEHLVELKNPYFPDFEKKIQVVGGETTWIRVSLDTLFGYLDLRVYPWGTLYINGENRGDTPLKRPVALPPGEHTISVKNPSYPDFVKQIVIQKRDTLLEKLSFEQ